MVIETPYISKEVSVKSLDGIVLSTIKKPDFIANLGLLYLGLDAINKYSQELYQPSICTSVGLEVFKRISPNPITLSQLDILSNIFAFKGTLELLTSIAYKENPEKRNYNFIRSIYDFIMYALIKYSVNSGFYESMTKTYKMQIIRYSNIIIKRFSEGISAIFPTLINKVQLENYALLAIGALTIPIIGELLLIGGHYFSKWLPNLMTKLTRIKMYTRDKLYTIVKKLNRLSKQYTK